MHTDRANVDMCKLNWSTSLSSTVKCWLTQTANSLAYVFAAIGMNRLPCCSACTIEALTGEALPRT